MLTNDSTAELTPLPALGITAHPAFAEQAAHLSAELGIPLQKARACLHLDTPWRLQLESDPPLQLQVDFSHGALDWRRKHSSGKTEPVVKAIWGRKPLPPSVFDATAGLARDSLLLAASGCHMLAMEQHPLLFALVRNALQSAAKTEDAPLAASIHRIDYRCGNSTEFLAAQAQGFVDVIYLDPMFPPRPGSAKVKNDMQVLQALHGPDTSTDLLQRALAKAGSKVVVKRPEYAPPLPGKAPGSSLAAGLNRFDIYPLA